MDNKTILYGGDPETITLSFPTDPKGLQELKGLIRERIKFFKENGVSEVYFYGADEATGEKLKAQRPHGKRYMRWVVSCLLPVPRDSLR